MLQRGSLSSVAPARLDDELVTTLARGPGVRVERIVSRGQRSADGFWYDQDETEYVLLVRGRAVLEVEAEGEVALAPGDWIVIPAHVRHRVAWTEPATETIWLAVFYAAGPS